MTIRHSAIVLAGGRSVRMGRAKAALPWRTRTMLEDVVQTVCAACSEVVVVAHAGQELPALPGVTRVDDPRVLDDQGPLVGALTGLAALASGDCVYLAAVDKPFVTVEHVRFMFEQLNPGFDAALPVEPSGDPRRRLHPLAGVLRVEPAVAAATQLVARGERALKRLYSTLRCREVARTSLPDDTVLLDCNTPADYRAAQRKLNP